ncbi:MAG TPA: sensor histidine kinase [Hyphomicrobiaceae bacterium]|nr:sensor histidine kinase [Hyphomicrobiaceae bacterium]
MKANSLALRLFITAAAWGLVVLPVAGWIIFARYRHEVVSAFDARIALFLAVVINDAEQGSETGPTEPDYWGEGLFVQTHSGWYWQMKPLDGKPAETLQSRSLAGDELPLPSENGVEPNDKEVRWADLTGPAQQDVRIAEMIYQFGVGKAAQRYSVAVAGRLSEVEDNLAAFRSQLTQALALAAVGLLAATLFQVRFGLFPLTRMERGLAAIRSGRASRLEGRLPSEVRPLQQELNALLKSNQEIVERSRTHVGNLAHALKTPLAVLINEARSDNSPLARKVTEQADVMTAQVNLYLDRARMAARIGVIGHVTEVGPVAESLVRALERLYRDKDLAFTLDCPPEARFKGERQDLEEMLGNLLDNACKWADSRVSVTVEAHPGAEDDTDGDWLRISVDDDGPGLTAAQRAEPIARGRRLDETKPGSGLGHSIVADLAYCYNGTFELGRSDSGGLSARLTLPLAM